MSALIMTALERYLDAEDGGKFPSQRNDNS
jgi:hypothetical protein